MPKVRAKLGFLVHLKEMFHHYGAVWKQMSPDEFEIVVAGGTEERSRIHAAAAEQGYHSVDVDSIINNGERYRHLVSNHCLENINGTPLVQIIGECNIRFMYALGKARHNFAAWNNLYNMIMCFGPYQAERLQFCESTVKLQMGYPRYDEFFCGNQDGASIAQKYGCDPNRKTIVWLPTWRELCSLDLYSDQMELLSSEYNLVVKPHPLSVQTEQERIERLRQKSFTRIITEHVDNLELFQVADFVVCDYGGPAFGALYLDKKLILLNMPGAETDQLTGGDSAEFSLRHSFPGLDTLSIPKIWGLLEDDGFWEERKQQARKLRDYYFAPFQGFSANVAAQALKHREAILAA